MKRFIAEGKQQLAQLENEATDPSRESFVWQTVQLFGVKSKGMEQRSGRGRGVAAVRISEKNIAPVSGGINWSRDWEHHCRN